MCLMPGAQMHAPKTSSYSISEHSKMDTFCAVAPALDTLVVPSYTSVLEELLLALVGYTGDVFVDDQDGSHRERRAPTECSVKLAADIDWIDPPDRRAGSQLTALREHCVLAARQTMPLWSAAVAGTSSSPWWRWASTVVSLTRLQALAARQLAAAACCSPRSPVA